MESKLEFGPARQADIDGICALVASAILHMQEQKIFQWDEKYPTREDFLNDLQENTLSVGTIEGKIAVTFTVNQTCEPEYDDGDWQYPNEEYRIIHRLCVNPEFQGRGVPCGILRKNCADRRSAQFVWMHLPKIRQPLRCIQGTVMKREVSRTGGWEGFI